MAHECSQNLQDSKLRQGGLVKRAPWLAPKWKICISAVIDVGRFIAKAFLFEVPMKRNFVFRATIH